MPNILLCYSNEKEEERAYNYKKLISNMQIEIALESNFEPLDYDLICYLYPASVIYKNKSLLILDHNIYLEEDILNKFNHILTNSPKNKSDLSNMNINSDLFLEKINLNIFGPDLPIEKRTFSVFLENKNDTLENYLSENQIPYFIRSSKLEEELRNVTYNQCSVYVDSSEEGASCTNILEAMCCGLVCITNNNTLYDQMKTIIKNDLSDNFYINKISEIKNNKDNLIKTSKETISELLSWHKEKRDFNQCLNNIICKNKGLRFA
jgi:glycosyltransferase involved in cell wall biosynthesis